MADSNRKLTLMILVAALIAAAAGLVYFPFLYSRYVEVISSDRLLFLDVSEMAGIRPHHSGPAWRSTFSVSVADYEKDGDHDIFVNNHERHRPYFYRNQNDGTFTESYESVGLLENTIGRVFGRPEIDDQSSGYFIWLDANPVVDGTWHIRWTSPVESRVAGSVRTNSAILTLQGVGLGAADTVESDETSVRFTATMDTKLRGFDIRPKFPESTVTFELDVNDQRIPDAIFIGPQAVNPNQIPFSLSLGDRHGTAWGDFNNDGSDDLFVTRGAMVGELKPPHGAKQEELFHSGENYTFENLIDQSQIRNDFGRGRDAQWVDFNNDGHLDIYISNHKSKNLLYENTGEGTFIDASARTGLDLVGFTHFVWADFDNNGLPDVLFSNPERLLLNNGDGPFSDATSRYRIAVERDFENKKDAMFWGSGVAVADYDGDGDLDAFVASGKGVESSALLENRGDIFVDVTLERGLEDLSNVSEGLWADYDNDGFVDLYTISTNPGTNKLFHNKSGRKFADVTEVKGLDLTQNYQWSMRDHAGGVGSWLDYDGDGFLDLFLATRRPEAEFDDPKNSGTSSKRLLTQVLSRIGNFVHGLMKGKRNGTHYLFRNSGNGNSWLRIDLTGTVSNRNGYGAKVLLKTGTHAQLSEAGASGKLLFAQNSVPLHFGVGKRTHVDFITVVWPSGLTQTFENVPTNQVFEVVEPHE